MEENRAELPLNHAELRKKYGKLAKTVSCRIVKRSSMPFRIRMLENPSTGYFWQVLEGKALRDEYLPSDTSGLLVGGGGERELEIDVSTRGVTVLIYSRPWEDDLPEEAQVLIVK